MPLNLEASIESIIQFGLTGLTIFLIIKPIIMWFMARADAKDVQIKELVENHFVKNQEVQERTITALNTLPEKIVDGITTIYSPQIYSEGGQAYKKILKKRR